MLTNLKMYQEEISNMIRKLFSLLAILTLIVLLVACGGGQTASSGDTGGGEAAGGEPLKVVLFINGVLGDKSFFDSAQRGIDRAKTELGIEAKTIEAGLDETQWEAGLVDAADNEEYDVMIVGTFQMISYLE